MNALRWLIAGLCAIFSALALAAPGWPRLPTDAEMQQAAAQYAQKYTARQAGVDQPGVPGSGGYIETRIQPEQIATFHNPKIDDSAQSGEAFLMVRRVTTTTRDESSREQSDVVILRLVHDGQAFTFSEHVTGWADWPSGAEVGQFLGAYLNGWYSQTLLDGYSREDLWMPGFAVGQRQSGAVEDGLADGGDESTTDGPGRYRAIIQIPPLVGGEVLSPSVEVVDEKGRPPTSSIYVSWFINGVNTPSVVWDGSETRVEVQVSVDSQAVVAAVVIPAAGAAPVSAAPASAAPTEPGAGLADGPVPGMTGAGPLPGPGSLGQALIGSLLPPLMIAIGQLLGGIRGGRPMPPGPVPLPPTPKQAPNLPPSKQPKPPAPKQPPSKQPKPPAPKQPPDPTAAWKQLLDRLEQVAKHDRNPQLAAAVQTMRGQLEGQRDPKAWAAAQQQLKNALGTLDQHLPKPNGVGWDAAASVVGGVKNAAVQAGEAIQGAGSGLLAFPGQVWQGLKGLGNGLLNPGHFVAGVNSVAKDWISKNLKTEGQAFVQGLKDGKVGDALGALGQSMVKAAGSVLGAAWEKIGKSILPVDELKSFTDPHASLEEKLWAVPAAAVKIAGILVGLQKPSTQPSTAWGEAIQQGLKRPVPAPPPTIVVQPKPKLPGTTRPRPAVPEAPASPQPAAKAPAASAPASSAHAPATPAATPPKKRYFQTTADGSEIEIVPPSEITPSNHSSVVGDISLESASRAKHYRFFKVDRSGIRMMEPGAGVEDLCDVMLPNNKRPWEITDTDIIVCTSDKAKAARIRAQVRRQLDQISRG